MHARFCPCVDGFYFVQLQIHERAALIGGTSVRTDPDVPRFFSLHKVIPTQSPPFSALDEGSSTEYSEEPDQAPSTTTSSEPAPPPVTDGIRQRKTISEVTTSTSSSEQPVEGGDSKGSEDKPRTAKAKRAWAFLDCCN